MQHPLPKVTPQRIRKKYSTSAEITSTQSMPSRFTILLINIFCTFPSPSPSPSPLSLHPTPPLTPPLTPPVPPLSILLLTGAGRDTLLSILLLIAGVIPSHIHAFYLSYVYFSRRKRVERGRYPGGVPRRRVVFDRRVWNGGVSDAVVEEIRVREVRRRESEGKKGRGKMWGGCI